jgi:PAS domain S-box-containing protein
MDRPESRPAASPAPSVPVAAARKALGRRIALGEHPEVQRDVGRTLRETRFFRLISPELAEAVLGEGHLLSLAQGEILIHEASTDTDAMYFLLGGRLDVISAGKYILSLVDIGEVIGEMGLIRHVPRAADVVAATEATLVEISRRRIEELRTRDPARHVQFLELMTLYLTEKLDITTRRVQQYDDLLLEREALRYRSETLEKEAGEKLRQVLLFSHVIRAAQDGILIADAGGRIVAANPAALALVGGAGSLAGTALPALLPQLADRLAEAGRTEAAGFKAECTLESAQGGTIAVEVTLSPVRQNERLIALAAFVRDIREQKRLLESLEQSKDELAGYSHRLENVVAERTQRLRTSNVELQKTNERLQQETVEKDQALRKVQETQAQLFQSEKMVALGHLAAGVAHEINNPMAFISSNLQTFRDYFESLRALLADYERLEAAAGAGRAAEVASLGEAIGKRKRAADYGFILEDCPNLIADSLAGAARVVEIVQNLKAFAHLDQSERQWANVNDGLENTLKLIWNEIKYKADVVRDYGDVPELECIPQLLNQVFLHLLLNAAEAISEKGRITVRTAVEQGHLLVEIADTGCGIRAEHLPLIFNPFFTTKPIGKGTGLGLSVAYNIVKAHQGTIEVQSEPGRGTTFAMRFPIATEASRSPGASS